MLCGGDSQRDQWDKHVSQKRWVDIKLNIADAEFPSVFGEEGVRISPCKLGVCAVCCLIINVGSFMVPDHRSRNGSRPGNHAATCERVLSGARLGALRRQIEVPAAPGTHVPVLFSF
jgi:hypothetical protein